MDKDKIIYQPISGTLYNNYELAILHRQKIKLSWNESGLTHIAIVTPIDLLTQQHQEFLIARDHEGKNLRIRLDYIDIQLFIDE